jgi:hypothetical protein
VCDRLNRSSDPCRPPSSSLIREFERDARDDNMPPDELNRRKKALVQELNGFIALKKAYSAQAAQRGELMQGASSSGGGGGLHMQELESEPTSALPLPLPTTPIPASLSCPIHLLMNQATNISVLACQSDE